jgi:hypothetical protein
MGTKSLACEYSGRGVALTTHPHLAEVKEKVELHLYSPSVPSWPVVGRTLPLPFYSMELGSAGTAVDDCTALEGKSRDVIRRDGPRLPANIPLMARGMGS